METVWQMRRGWVVLVWLTLAGVAGAAVGPNPYESLGSPTGPGPLDRLVKAQLDRLNLRPADVCSDGVFVRRAFLDVIGTLPTAAEAKEFLLKQDPQKRKALIDRLLAREEFADYWAMRWGDLLRVKAEYPINLWPNAAQAYHRWLRTAVLENKPYDQFVRALLTASGSNFRVPPANFYRAVQNREPAGLAQAVALTFLGARLETWPAAERNGLAAFFSQVGYKSTAEWKEEIVFFDPSLATNGLAAGARLPDGTSARLAPDRDPREVFADWLLAPGNPWFARNIANRAWSWLLGRGIIHEPDDIRPDNPAANPELLAWLERELVSARYDLKHLFRVILNSQTYQRSCVPRSDSPAAAAQFASYPLRRLEAEVLIDALNQLTGSTEKYSSPIPEPFTFIPEDQRSIALPDGSITSPFLEMFGRPPRDTGLESERNNRPTTAQRRHLLNSSHVQRKLDQSQMVRFLSGSGKPPREAVTAVYLGVLSRFPTEPELQTALAYAQAGTVTRREATVDLAWALINSTEFLYRH